MNNPVLIEETTRMRMELLGLSMTPQHSDARVLDQIIYKWQHSKKIIGRVLVDKYSDLMDTGWKISRRKSNVMSLIYLAAPLNDFVNLRSYFPNAPNQIYAAENGFRGIRHEETHAHRGFFDFYFISFWFRRVGAECVAVRRFSWLRRHRSGSELVSHRLRSAK